MIHIEDEEMIRLIPYSETAIKRKVPYREKSHGSLENLIVHKKI
jgi:hypothetical protein